MSELPHMKLRNAILDTKWVNKMFQVMEKHADLQKPSDNTIPNKPSPDNSPYIKFTARDYEYNATILIMDKDQPGINQDVEREFGDYIHAKRRRRENYYLARSIEEASYVFFMNIIPNFIAFLNKHDSNPISYYDRGIVNYFHPELVKVDNDY